MDTQAGSRPAAFLPLGAVVALVRHVQLGDDGSGPHRGRPAMHWPQPMHSPRSMTTTAGRWGPCRWRRWGRPLTQVGWSQCMHPPGWNRIGFLPRLAPDSQVVACAPSCASTRRAPGWPPCRRPCSPCSPRQTWKRPPPWLIAFSDRSGASLPRPPSRSRRSVCMAMLPLMTSMSSTSTDRRWPRPCPVNLLKARGLSTPKPVCMYTVSGLHPGGHLDG